MSKLEQALIFPGQGSQSVGMGKEFYDAFASAREVFEEVDDSLEQKLSELIFNGDQSELTLTENAQPALMAVSIAILKTIEKEGGKDISELADYLAGHSLGEYTALCAARAISISDTAKLLRIRGEAMQSAVPVGQGAMAAVIGLSLEDCNAVAEAASYDDNLCVVANDNCPGQVVLSGHMKAIDRAISIAPERGAKRSIKLAVSAPFHCELMLPAAKKMQDTLAGIEINAPQVPVIANVSAEPTVDSQSVRKNLVDQVTGRVRWRETGENLAKLGVRQTVEVGAGKVLTGMMKRIGGSINALSISTPQDMESFL